MAERDIRKQRTQQSIGTSDIASTPGKLSLVEQHDLGTVPAPSPHKGLYGSPGKLWNQSIAHAPPKPLVGTSSAARTSAGSAGASTSGPVDTDQKQLAMAIVTGYQAAQHALETSGSTGATFNHLQHVANVSPEYRGKEEFENVWAAADNFELALRARWKKSPAQYQQLVDINQRVRGHIGLTGPSKSQVDHAAGDDASYAKSAIAPAFDALSIRVRDALHALEEIESHDQAARLRVIERVAGEISFSSEYVMGLLEQIPKEQRQGFASAANTSALAIGRVLRWVRTRPAHEQLEAKLLRGVDVFDHVLRSTGAETLGERDEVPLTENQRHGAEVEQSEFDQAFDDAKGAIESISKLQKNKITLFQNLAGLEDQPQPDFKTTLLNAIIDATVTTMLGQFAKVIVAAPPAVNLPIAATTVSLPAPPKEQTVVGIDNIFTISFGSVKTAMATKLAAPAGGIDPTKRALHYFCDGLQAAEDARAQAYAEKLNGLKKRSAITRDQLRDIQQLARSQKTDIVDHQLQEITKGWARYLAQSRLGARSVGHDRLSKMGDYFGEQRPGGRTFGTSKAGGSGILTVTMLVDNGRPILDPSATKVIGLNSELQSLLFTSADHELARIELPKELHVHARFARATIALDEKNHVRDVINWDQVQTYVGMNAASFWRTWGHGLKVG